jgi:hypothetical protein
MNGWAIFGLVVLGVIVLGVAVNAHDIARYLRIRSM